MSSERFAGTGAARLKKLFGLSLAATAAAGLLLVGGCSQHQKDADASAKADPALVNAVIKQLEDSGKLDDAVQKSVQHLIEKQREKREQAMDQQQKQLEKNAAKMGAVNPKTDHLKGNPDATITMIEYADYECPFCKRFHTTPERVMKKFGDQVNWVYRDMPLSFHGKAAVVEGKAGECAAQLGGNKVYWPYSNAMFNASESNGKGLGGGKTVYSLAKQYGLNEAKFKACMNNPATQKILDDNTQGANKMGITGTPTTIIRNNKTGDVKVIVGAQPEQAVEQAVKDLLNGNKDSGGKNS